MTDKAGPLSLDELTVKVREFASERDWEQFHPARNLLLALVGEVGELAEQFQWVSDDRVSELLSDPIRHKAVSDELADVLIYLARLADVLEVDLSDVTIQKLDENATRYPPEMVQGSSLRRLRSSDE